MYRGKSTAGKMSDFDREAYEDTFSTQCVVGIDKVTFSSTKKLGGKISAGISMYVNGSQICNLPNLGYLQSKSGYYEWDQHTTVKDNTLPVSVPVVVSDKVSIKATITYATGIPLISKGSKGLHS